MATIRNEIDIILQAASPRILPVSLPSNVNVDFSEITGITKPENNATLGATWATNVSGKPTDLQIMNDQIQTQANLVPGLVKWTLSGGSFIYANSPYHLDKNALVIPAGNTSTVNTIVISTNAAQKIFAGQTYTLSFKAWCNSGTRTITADLYPDTLPESNFLLSTTPMIYTVQWTPIHGDTSGTVSLRFFTGFIGDIVYIGDIKLEVGSVRTTWNYHILDNIGINNKITLGNYATHMSAQSVSLMAYAEGSSVPSSVSRYVDLYFNSDGKNVILILSGMLASSEGVTTPEYSEMTMQLKINGTIKRSFVAARVPGNTAFLSTVITASHPHYEASPGGGSVHYELTTYYGGGVSSGISGGVYSPSIQIAGFHV